MNRIKWMTATMALLLITGCATIVGDKTQSLQLNSKPDDAMVTITDENGVEVFKGKTPANVTLEKSDGSYFGGKTYIVRISKDGYETQSVQVNSKMNGWYIAGNFVFGGLIGWFIVDPLSGAMYNLSPEQVNAQLNSSSASNNSTPDGIRIVLLKDVPQQLRAHMVKIR